jgi:hypothetical protein
LFADRKSLFGTVALNEKYAKNLDSPSLFLKPMKVNRLSFPRTAETLGKNIVQETNCPRNSLDRFSKEMESLAS